MHMHTCTYLHMHMRACRRPMGPCGPNEDTQTLPCTQDPSCSYAQQVENVTLFEQSSKLWLAAAMLRLQDAANERWTLDPGQSECFCVNADIV